MKLEIYVAAKPSQGLREILDEILRHVLEVLKLLGLEATGALLEDKGEENAK